MSHLYHKASYLLGAPELKYLPPDDGFEVAFIGRSNAGKSSALNTITGIKGLARTSKTPGRTQMINLFSLDEKRRLVDLPGYGYAKVPRVVQARWVNNCNEYLKKRHCLKGLVIVMDIRHPLKDMDCDLIDWAISCDLPIHVLLTKADKLSSNEKKKILDSVQASLKTYPAQISVQIFSSLKSLGIKEAHDVLNAWFELTPNCHTREGG
jgi:GTP-binding protein